MSLCLIIYLLIHPKRASSQHSSSSADQSMTEEDINTCNSSRKPTVPSKYETFLYAYDSSCPAPNRGVISAEGCSNNGYNCTLDDSIDLSDCKIEESISINHLNQVNTLAEGTVSHNGVIFVETSDSDLRCMSIDSDDSSGFCDIGSNSFGETICTDNGLMTSL